MFKTIVIGTDGSPESAQAFEIGRSMAREAAARVVMVHVVELVGGKGGVHTLAIDEDRIRADIDEQADQLRKDGLESELVIEQVVFGGPAHVISDVARSVDADVIVVGSRGRTPVSELLTGSVPIRLLQTAHRPVLVVPLP